MNLLIEKLIYHGDGAGRIDGKMIFVPFSAPGDLLDITVTEDHGSYAHAKINHILEKSPNRAEPRCPVFGVCGGCQWQHLSYETQIDWKKKILVETFSRLGMLGDCVSIADIVQPTLSSPKIWNYRNKIQLHVDSKGQVGFYRAGSKQVVEFDKCMIAEDELNNRLNQMRESLRTRAKGIGIRKEEGPAFSQVNTSQNEQMKKVLRSWLQEIPHDRVLELFAGSGNFTFYLADIIPEIIASDIDGRAVRYAKDRIKKEQILNVKFFCEEAHKTILRIKDKIDVVILDPPRKGCFEVAKLIHEIKPSHVLYISCDPATLSRDLKLLNAHGYKLIKSLPVDMFPQTYHIESINLLFKG